MLKKLYLLNLISIIEAQELQPPNIKGKKMTKKTSSSFSYKWWLQMGIYAFLALAGQTAGTLLGRSYFDNGGESNWIAASVQVAGFPILFATRTNKAQNHNIDSFSIAIGIFLAATCMLYSIGLQYQSIATLICSSQLGFNVVFIYFLNQPKLTPYTLNTLGLLTISSAILIIPQTELESPILCTLAASTGYTLILFLRKGDVFRIKTIRATIDPTIYQNMVAAFVILIGLVASGDWKKLRKEMKEYKLGQVCYVMNLFWATVSWLAFNVGRVGLMFKVSSFFSNFSRVFVLPVAPILVMIFLNDELTGLKAMASWLAMCGFVSYLYQHYLDVLKMNNDIISGLFDTNQQVSEDEGEKEK